MFDMRLVQWNNYFTVKIDEFVVKLIKFEFPAFNLRIFLTILKLDFIIF